MDFVLDENIVLFAAKFQDASGEEDHASLTALTTILSKCDIMHCSRELYRKYLDKLHNLGAMNQSGSFVEKLLIHMKKLGKLRLYDYEIPPKLPEERGIPEDDIFIIRLTVWTKSILVTSDCRLKEHLANHGLIQKYNLVIRKPWEL
jgi:hypothetical protein